MKKAPGKLLLSIWMLSASWHTPPLVAMHPNHPLSFSPDRSYQIGFGGVDHVDLFSGSLLLQLPVGPFLLSYSSNVWVYERVDDPVTQQSYIQAIPDRERSAGLGWHLGVGELYSPTHWYNPSDRWMYVDPEGNRHYFFDTLHRGEAVTSGVSYTRDGSYLRRTKVSNCKYIIESPDGTSRSLVAPTCGGGSTYRLARVWSPFGSESDPDLRFTYSNGNLTVTVTDRYGRSHVISYSDQYSWIHRVVTRIDLESVGGQRALYDFSYDNVHVDRSCKDDDPSTGARMRLPHLVRISFPDGTSYSMKKGSQRFYYNHCSHGMDSNPGVLTGLIGRTLGKLEWSFQEYEFPPGDGSSVFNTSAGLKTRRLLWKNGLVHGEWRYKTSRFWPPGGEDPEIHTQVVYPTGDCTKHFFNARYWLTPSQGKGWERGLPFAYSESDRGRYLSSEVWTSNNGAGSCSGTKLRSTYVRYVADQTPGNNQDAQAWILTNRRLKESHTVFHDDGERFSAMTLSSFDGLGHFRRKLTTGNFWAASANDEERESFTQYNPDAGTYPSSFVPIEPSAPWILDTFEHTREVESGALGESITKTEFTFDRTTGFLQCERVLASGQTRSSHDILETYSANSLGQVTDVRRYGGDLQTLSTAEGCDAAGLEPDYWTRHTFSRGLRVSSRPLDPSGLPAPFFTYDVDRDPHTGLVTARRTRAGVETVLSYDPAGRIATLTPAEGASTQFVYVNASNDLPARRIRRVADPGPGGEIYSERELEFDDFGRLSKARLGLPGGGWSEQEIRYNARGWTTSISEIGDLRKTTDFLAFDPFGRATVVRPADGAVHDELYSFGGLRTVTRKQKIARVGGEAYVTSTRELDRYGRLRKVLEDSGDPTGGRPNSLALIPTTFRYDVGSRLTEIISGSDPVQQRRFEYDNRGFLLAATHPEKGPAGQGTVSFLDLDSRGKHHRLVDGPNDLELRYDPYGRLTQLRDLTASGRLVKRLQYDTAQGFGLGRLWRSVRYNWHDLPWTAPGEEAIKVTETHTYRGLNGRLSQKRTKVALPGEAGLAFDQAYGYADDGHLDLLSYPECADSACLAAVGPARSVGFEFDAGLLTAVPGWAGPLTYDSSLRISLLPHANGVTDHFETAEDVRSRIARIFTVGSSNDWDTGFYDYDGASNIRQIGTDTFAYDGAQRLVEAEVQGYRKEYSYDTFGNLTEMTTTPPGGVPQVQSFAVDSSTNRLATLGYDEAGNTVSSGGHAYSYDRTNQLKAVNGRWLYLYDADGERVALIDWTGSLATRRVEFRLRGLDRQLLSRYELVGDTATGGWERKRDFVWMGRNLLASVGSSGATTHYHLDHLGSPRLLTDASGTAIKTLAFFPYGGEIGGGSATDLIQFTGHERDHETALDYMHARHYTSDLGRFLSVDSWNGFAGEPQSLNRYAYVKGSPLTFIDPDGRSWFSVVRSVVGGLSMLWKGANLFDKALHNGLDPYLELAYSRRYPISIPGEVPGLDPCRENGDLCLGFSDTVFVEESATEEVKEAPPEDPDVDIEDPGDGRGDGDQGESEDDSQGPPEDQEEGGVAGGLDDERERPDDGYWGDEDGWNFCDLLGCGFVTYGVVCAEGTCTTTVYYAY